MEKVIQCSASKVELSNNRGSVIFSCPKCAQADIIRSFHSRELGTKYTCPKCGFEGPN
ncbi:MAG: zinc finger domain-containing protein [bacterium]|nr:zinc finger domain-containing protein [bacterium]